MPNTIFKKLDEQPTLEKADRMLNLAEGNSILSRLAFVTTATRRIVPERTLYRPEAMLYAPTLTKVLYTQECMTTPALQSFHLHMLLHYLANCRVGNYYTALLCSNIKEIYADIKANHRITLDIGDGHPEGLYHLLSGIRAMLTELPEEQRKKLVEKYL